MKCRNTLFQGWCVRAIAKGLKTVTRRLVKPQPSAGTDGCYHRPDGRWIWLVGSGGLRETPESPGPGIGNSAPFSCPYGIAGDLLRVREAWADADIFYQCHTNDAPGVVTYRADHQAIQFDASPVRQIPAEDLEQWNWDVVKWRPSIYMFDWMARYYLTNLGPSVERVQDISEADAKAEGLTGVEFRPDEGFPLCLGYPAGPDTGECTLYPTAKEAFSVLWDEMHAKPKPVYERKQIIGYASYPWAEGNHELEHRGLPWQVCGNPWLWRLPLELTEERP